MVENSDYCIIFERWKPIRISDSYSVIEFPSLHIAVSRALVSNIPDSLAFFPRAEGQVQFLLVASGSLALGTGEDMIGH